jgi:hypothetical protein
VCYDSACRWASVEWRNFQTGGTCFTYIQLTAQICHSFVNWMIDVRKEHGDKNVQILNSRSLSNSLNAKKELGSVLPGYVHSLLNSVSKTVFLRPSSEERTSYCISQNTGNISLKCIRYNISTFSTMLRILL